jgi:two-component system cell cycle sensor histidine kinase PleC
MTAGQTHWTAQTEECQRESRIDLALLRGVIDNLRPNRIMVPFFGLLVSAMFTAWVPVTTLAAWYAQVLIGLAPQIALSWFMPDGELSPRQVRNWTRAVAGADLAFVLSWASLGWYLWVPGNDFDHILIELVLASTLASHAALVAASRPISLCTFIAYGVAMTLVPLQAHTSPYTYLALVAPFYVGYIAVIARQHHARARATIVLAEEKNALLAELVLAKLESDRGRERAEAANLAKSQFLANMSHELRTPLNAILGFSELIATRMFASDPERNYEYAGLIHSSGHHLLALINDILDLAKIEAGRWKLEEAEIDLHRIAEEALALVAWRAKDNDATLENRIDRGLARLYADERAIKQILLNLLSNAVKFTPAHGRVTAFADLDPRGNLVFGVSDTGVGISEADQNRVFDSFGQGKHDIAIADKGTGLGLAIVKGLAEAHGGHVALNSEVGKGTRVTVTMPAARVRPRALPAHAMSG